MRFRHFADVERWFASATDYERHTGGLYSTREYNLARMARLLEALGHPERRFRSIHVAGTKGKGSTCHLAEAVLRGHGLRTGLYTSPHLVHMRERIRLDGEPVSERALTAAMNRMAGALARVKPTYFETMTAAALEIFADRRVDVGVIEVGMGGRLDATNLIRPDVAVITTIDFDHVEKLGRTLAKIASEKAGILKAGVPAVTSETKPAPLRAIRDRAHELGIPLLEVRPGCVPTRLPGRHQQTNIAAALKAVELFLGRLDRRTVRRMLAEVRIPARLEILRGSPLVILDAGHNPAAAQAAAETIRGLRWQRCACVFGASRDKDWRRMIRILDPQVDVWIFTEARSPRACPIADLAKATRKPALVQPSAPDAVRTALSIARPEDLVLVTGSFYVAGEADPVLRS